MDAYWNISSWGIETDFLKIESRDFLQSINQRLASTYCFPGRSSHWPDWLLLIARVWYTKNRASSDINGGKLWISKQIKNRTETTNRCSRTPCNNWLLLRELILISEELKAFRITGNWCKQHFAITTAYRVTNCTVYKIFTNVTEKTLL